MARKDRIDALGATALVVFSGLLGFNQALIKLVNAGFAPALQAGLRSLIALVPVLIYALLTRKRISLGRGGFWPGIACGVFFCIEFILLFVALDLTSVARASIFFYSMPVWVALGAHVLIPGERLTRAKLMGLALAVGGVTLALSSNAAPATEKALLGDLLCLLAAVAWAGIALVARATPLSEATPEAQLLIQLAVSAPVLIGVAFLTGDTVRAPEPLHVGILAFQSLGIVACGYLVWFRILAIYPASDMASFGFLAPVFGVFFGWLIFDEPLTLRLLAALALVGLGIVLVNRKPRRAGLAAPGVRG